MLAVALFGVAAAARGALLPTPKAGITQRTVHAPRAPLPRMDEGGLDGMGEEVGDGERGARERCLGASRGEGSACCSSLLCTPQLAASSK